MIVTVGYGKAVLKKSSVSMTAFSMRKDQPSHRRALSVDMGAPVSRRQEQAGIVPEIDGTLYANNFDVKDGQGIVLCLQVSKTVNASPMADAAMFIRLREAGAMLCIQAKMPVDPARTPASRASGLFTMFMGRGDILTATQLEKEHGILVNRAFKSRFLIPEEVRELFVVQEVSPETAPAPAIVTLTNPAGEEVRIAQHKPVRRIKVKRG